MRDLMGKNISQFAINEMLSTPKTEDNEKKNKSKPKNSSAEKKTDKVPANPVKPANKENQSVNEVKDIKKTVVPVQENVRVYEYEPIFDISDSRVIKPKRIKRNTGTTGVTHSIYCIKEEWDIVEALADKYGMTVNNVIRILILNAK